MAGSDDPGVAVEGLYRNWKASALSGKNTVLIQYRETAEKPLQSPVAV